MFLFILEAILECSNNIIICRQSLGNEKETRQTIGGKKKTTTSQQHEERSGVSNGLLIKILNQAQMGCLAERRESQCPRMRTTFTRNCPKMPASYVNLAICQVTSQASTATTKREREERASRWLSNNDNNIINQGGRFKFRFFSRIFKIIGFHQPFESVSQSLDVSNT